MSTISAGLVKVANLTVTGTQSGAVTATNLTVENLTASSIAATNIGLTNSLSLTGDLTVGGNIQSTINGTNNDPFCMSYPQGPYAIQRLEFAKMNSQIKTACPWSETLLDGTIFDPTFYVTDTSSYTHAVPLNDSSFNFDTSGVKFPGNFYFKDPITQLIPCSAPIPTVYTVFVPVNGEKTKQNYFTESLTAGKFNIDDIMLMRCKLGGSNDPNNSATSMNMDVDIGPNSLYQLFKAYDFTTITGLNVAYPGSSGQTYLSVIQNLQITCTPGTPGTIFTTLLKFIVGGFIGSSPSPLDILTTSTLYALIQSSDNYINFKNFKTWSGYSPSSTDIENNIYKSTFDFTQISKTDCPIILLPEISDTVSYGSINLAESLASFGIIVVSVGYLYNAISCRRIQGNPLTALEIAQTGTMPNWIGNNTLQFLSTNNTHLFYRNYHLNNDAMGYVANSIYTGIYIYNARTVDSEWGIGSLATNIDLFLDIMDTLKNVKSTISSDSLGDYIDFMSIGNIGYSGSTALGAALNAMAIDETYNTEYMCKAIFVGNGMMLIPYDDNDSIGCEITPETPSEIALGSAGRIAERWYPNGFNISALLQINEADSHFDPAYLPYYRYGSWNGTRYTVGCRKYLQETIRKTNFITRCKCILAETWGEYHAPNDKYNYGGHVELFGAIAPNASGIYVLNTGTPNWDDQLFNVSKLSRFEFVKYFAYNLAELLVRYFRSQLTKDINIESTISLPFNLQIAPWIVDSADDYTVPYQQFDMDVGGAGTFTVPYQKNQIELRLKNNEPILTASTDSSGNNPTITIGEEVGAFSNTNLLVNGNITIDSSGTALNVNGVTFTASDFAALYALIHP